MIVQCKECRRIRVDGQFRLPWPGELDGEIVEVFCPRCAKELIARVRAGEFAHGYGEAVDRRAANL